MKSVSNKVFVKLQYILPKKLLTLIAGKIAGWHGGRITTYLIKDFIQRYSVDMNEAACSDIHTYRTFNDFFARALKPGIRPFAHSTLVCPVDGAVSQFGSVKQGQLFQAKGQVYSALALLGGDRSLAHTFQDGHFATLYLSPKDYHRIHLPCAGQLLRMIYVPGALFSVNPATVAGVPGLFTRNERVICIFQTAYGEMAIILVGATIVGSIVTRWHGVVNPGHGKVLQEWQYVEKNICFQQGEEIGRFLLGSTVIVLWSKHIQQFDPRWVTGQSIRMGEYLAN